MAEQDVRSQTNGGSRPGEQQKEQQEPPKDPAKAKRRRTIVIAVLAVVAIGLFLYWLHSRNFEDTDDAQVDGNLTAVSSRVPGTVTAVHVDDNQEVKQGDLLVELDPADLQVALAQAKAAVALAQAQLQSEQPLVPMTQSTNVATLSSAEDEVASAQADMDAAQRDLDQSEAQNRFAQQQLARAKQLVTSNTIPQSELDQRQSAADAAAAAVAAARKRIDQRRARLQQAEARRKEAQANAPRQLSARTATLSVRQANLELAQAQLKQAELNLGYARIVAPVAGIAGKRSVNVGDRVGPGQQLMSITQVGDLWVTANFRETQIEHMRAGQSAEVHVDALDRDYQATVESFAGATGSRYSLLPPENASGNYVKVVQRIPVRLRFNPGQPDMERLRPGMSAEPKVRVR
ncbi:MAG TPA: HlyD family secretion protein [Myxococcales bacterium]|nr:HlyD family secretion protein [Myxococcales bacterium]